MAAWPVPGGSAARPGSVLADCEGENHPSGLTGAYVAWSVIVG
jgi:hypothetical protein